MRGPDAASPARVWGWLALCALPAIVFPGAVAEAAFLPDSTGPVGTLAVDPRFAMARLAFPVVAASGGILLMAPGLMLALASRRAHTLGTWAIASVPVTLALLVLLPSVAHVLGGFPEGRFLAAGTLLLSALCGMAAVALRRRRGVAHLPTMRAADIAYAVAIPILLAALLAPKFLWEDVNGDGAHAFEASRLLLTQAWPFFPASAGDVASFPGMTSMLFAFPNAWFLGVFGEVDAAVRMPYLLYVALLGCGLHALAESGRIVLTRGVVAAIWGSLVVFSITMAFSATYSRYNADLAMPAAQDALFMVCVLGFVLSMIQRSWGLAAAFGFASFVSLPSGLLLMAFWIVAELAVVRPRPWRVAAAGLVIIAGSMLIAAALAGVIAATGSPAPGTEYGMRRTISDLMVLQVADWRRVLYAAVPGGIFPAVALLLWRRQDDVARRVTLVVAAYFAFFFIQSRISLHHFVPAMLLPIVVAARVIPAGDGGRRWTVAWCAAAAVSLAAALPGTGIVSRVSRPVAGTISHALGGRVVDDDATVRHALHAAGPLLGEVFPPDWDPGVPDSTYGGSMLVWLHYMRPGGPDAETNYLLADARTAAPSGMRRIAQRDSVALYLRSDSVLALHRAVRPVGMTGAAIFRIAQRDLFLGRGGRGQVDVAALLRRVGVDVTPFLQRSGN